MKPKMLKPQILSIIENPRNRNMRPANGVCDNTAPGCDCYGTPCDCDGTPCNIA